MAQRARPGQTQTLANVNGTRGDVILEGDGTFPAAGVVLRSKTSWPDVSVQLGATDATSSFRVFNSSGTGLFSVHNGQSWFQKASTIFLNTETVNPYIALRAEANGYFPAMYWSTFDLGNVASVWMHRDNGMYLSTHLANRAIIFTPNTVEAMRVTGNGLVGIGTAAPQRKLHVLGGSDVTGFPGTPMTITIGDVNPYTTPNTGPGISFDAIYNSLGHMIQIGVIGAVKESNVDGHYAGSLTFGTRVNGSGGGSMERMRIRSTGEVVIGSGPASPASTKLTVNGDVVVNGNIGAKYQDLAEWVPADDDLQPGSVVVLSATQTNQVTLSSRPYDTRVAGVVSDQPGILLGIAGERSEKIATTGRVRVRVDATNAPVAIGDLLVTSPKPGMAMKSAPVDLNGIAIHRPGTIVGKALEPLPNGEGEILVLLSLQ